MCKTFNSISFVVIQPNYLEWFNYFRTTFAMGTMGFSHDNHQVYFKEWVHFNLVAEHYSLLSDVLLHPGWSVVTDLSRISDLSQKFRPDSGKVMSEHKLQQK